MAVRMMIIDPATYAPKDPAAVWRELTAEEKETLQCVGTSWENAVRFVTEYEGCVLRLRERNMYHDSDFYALVWDAEIGAPREVEYGTTRFPTYGNTAHVDATEAVLAAYNVWQAQQRQAAAERRAEEERRTPYAGKVVEVTGGRKLAKGTLGVVFWRGEDKYRPSRIIPAFRVGVKTDDGQKVFLSEDNVEVDQARTAQLQLNEIAKVIWPRYEGNMHPDDITMKLMEIAHEWKATDRERCEALDGAVGMIDDGNLEQALVLVKRGLR